MTAKAPTRRVSRGFDVLLQCDAVVDGREYESITLHRQMTLPYLPRAGDELGLGADHDFMTVETVYWHPQDGYAIWLSDCESAHLTKLMLEQGWVEQ